MKQTILLALIFLFTKLIIAQAPEVEWFKAQGTNTEEHVHDGFQTSDGGYIGIGHGIETSGSDDMLIIKVDQDGKLEWKQDFGTSGKKGAGYCIAEISDGFIAGGAIYDPDSLRTQRFLARLDLQGEIIWEKYFGSEGIGGIRGIDITSDGSFVVTGYKNTPNTYEFRGFVFIVDDGDGFVMKLDMNGNVEWEKLIDAPQGTKVREIDDGFAVCSCVWTWSQETGDQQDFCLFELDSDGNTIWKKLYGGDKSDHLYDFDLTSDGGFILVGHTLSYGVENWDYLLMKIDHEGNEEWFKIFGQPRGYDPNYIHDESYGVRQTPDGGYIICGGSGDEYSYSESGHSSGPSDEWKVYLVRTDGTGILLWEGIYPPSSVGNNGGEFIGLTNDGGYIVFVDTDSKRPPAPNNFGFMKLALDSVTNVRRDENFILSDYELKQNYPNPFNPSTTIVFSLKRASHASIMIYDILGNEIVELLNEYKLPNKYSIQFNSNGLSSGTYICRLQAGEYSGIIKMIYVK